MIQMKTIITLMLVLLSSTAALANNAPADVKVEFSKMVIVLADSTPGAASYKEISAVKEAGIARLYKNKYTRVKKALNFNTKRNQTKLA